MSDAPGELPDVPGFVVGDEVGRGGMGVVFRARDLSLDREVAVKLLQDKYAPDSGAARRFTDEARITAQLQHPGIPPVYHVGTAGDGRPFLAMKLIKGDTLDVLLKSSAPLDKLGVFQAVAQAVGYAHAHGVIHRDLKPANVMVGAFGEVQVMDWGLAKVLTVSREAKPSADPEATVAAGTEVRSPRDSDTPFTEYGSALGTPAFMPPEQAAGELDKVGPASDVFGLGAVLCVLLTGKPPFTGDNPDSVRIAAMRGETADALRRLDASGAEPGVVSLCKRCLAFKPEDRPADAGVVAAEVAALRAAADERARRAEVEAGESRVREAEGRKRRRLAMAAAGVLAVAAAVAGWQAWRATAAERATTAELGRRVEAERVARDEAGNARAAERVADDRRRLADDKTRLAEASSSFLKRVLVQSSPERLTARDGPFNRNRLLREALDLAAKEIDGRFPGQPQVEADLRGTIGNAYRDLRQFEAARPQLEQAVRLWEQALGPDAPETLESVTHLGLMFLEAFDPASAEPLLRRVADTCQAALGPNHERTLRAMHNLALVFMDRGQLPDAAAMFRRVLAGSPAGAADGELTGMAAFALGQLLVQTGEYRDAAPLIERGLAYFLRAGGPEHPYTLNTRALMAMLAFRTGDFVAADRQYAELLPVQERVLGPDHPDTLSTAHELALSAVRLRSDLDTAERLLRRVVAARERAVPQDHVNLLVSVNVLADVLRLRGNTEAAEPLYRRAAEGVERLDFADQDATKYISGYVACLLALGRPAEAESWQRKRVTLARRQDGAESADLAQAVATLGSIQLRQDRWADAEATLRSALAGREKLAAGPKPTVPAWQVANTKSLLGAALLGLRRHADADPLLRAGYTGLQADAAKLPPAAKPNLPQAVDRLIRLARATGDAGELAKWQAERAKYPPEVAPPPRAVR